MKAFKKLAFVIIGTLLSLTLLSCGGGGGGGGGVKPPATGGGGGGGGGVKPSATVITGDVVDGFIAGATVTAYQVNANGTQGAQIGTPTTTDSSGNYTLNLGTYSGPVYLTSQGGTYTDTATGLPIDLNNPPYSSMILSAIVSNASGNVTAQINPITTMAADLALTFTGQGTPVATAANDANSLMQDYFGLTSSILNTALVNLTTAGCLISSTTPSASADASAILAGISELASQNSVSTPDLVQALIQDVTSDGLFDGMASGVTISVPLTPGPGSILLSTIEGTGLTKLASAITTFMTTTTAPNSNVCAAMVDPVVISALSNTNIFTAPAAPTGVAATSEDGAAIVSWSAVANATSYNIYMAASSAVTPTSNQLPGYQKIPNVFSPAVISTGLTSTTYYFVVTAVSGTSPFTGYESAPSSPPVSTAVIASKLPTQWAQTVTAGSDQSSFNSVAEASDGSVYAAGYITGTGAYNFSGGVITAGTYTTGLNAVLVKFNSSGVAQWAQSVTAGVDDSYFYSVSVASDGSVYAAGYIASGTFNFGSGAITGTNPGYNPILVKYNSSGVVQWAHTVTAGSEGSFFNSVSAAPDGSVYAAGFISGTGIFNFGSSETPVNTQGLYSGDNIVLVKYNSAGAAQWAQTLGAPPSSDSLFNGVSAALDGSGSVYAAGYMTGTGIYNFGNGVTATGTNPIGINLVLVQYNSSGVAQWAQTVAAGSSFSNFYSVAAASDGSVYAAGDLYGTGTYNFGNSVTAGGTFTGYNPLVVKYNSAGLAQWAQTVAAGTNESEFYGVSVGSDGSVYAAGYMTGTGIYNFGNGVTATGAYNGENIVLVSYDSSGAAQWAPTVIVGSGPSVFSGVSASGGLYTAGQIYGTSAYNLGNGVTAAGAYSYENIVLVKYSGFGSITLSW